MENVDKGARLAALHDEAQNIVNLARDQNRSLTLEESTRFDNIAAEFSRVQLERDEDALNAQAAYLAAPKPRKTAAHDPRAHAAHQAGRRSPEAVAFSEFARTGIVGARNAMSIGSGPDGGYAVPPELAQEIARVALLFSPLRALAKVTQATSASYTRLISTTAAGAQWAAELDVRNLTATPTLASIVPPSGELSAVASVTQWLLNDSSYNLEGFIAEEIGKSHGVAEGAAFINGTGTAQPKGILQYALAATPDGTRPFGTIEQLKSGASASFTADHLIQLLYRLRPQYRSNATWLMNPATLQVVRQFKDSQGRYIWEPAGAAGQPSTLFGVPVFEDPNVPAPGPASNAVLVGDFRSGYEIVDVGQQITLRDPYTTKGSVLFWVAKRVGGAVIDSNAIKVLTLSA